MAKCKYPNEVCANMTVLHGVAYCDSVPCSMKDELPKQTYAERVRSMTDEELAFFLIKVYNMIQIHMITTSCMDRDKICHSCLLKWLQSEIEKGELSYETMF